MAALLSAQAWSAPLNAGAAEQPDAAEAVAVPAGAGTAEQAATADLKGNSKTIQMLLELQAGKGMDDAARKPDAANPRARAPKQEPLFGASDVSIVGGGLDAKRLGSGKDAARPESVEWLGNTGGRGGASSYHAVTVSARDAYEPVRPQSAGDEVDVRGWLPTSLVRYLRHNREVVLMGSLAVLLILGFGAAFATKKR